jgi:hypothetical protein
VNCGGADAGALGKPGILGAKDTARPSGSVRAAAYCRRPTANRSVSGYSEAGSFRCGEARHPYGLTPPQTTRMPSGSRAQAASWTGCSSRTTDSKVGEARDWEGVARLGVDIGDLRET